MIFEMNNNQERLTSLQNSLNVVGNELKLPDNQGKINSKQTLSELFAVYTGEYDSETLGNLRVGEEII